MAAAATAAAAGGGGRGRGTLAAHLQRCIQRGGSLEMDRVGQRALLGRRWLRLGRLRGAAHRSLAVSRRSLPIERSAAQRHQSVDSRAATAAAAPPLQRELITGAQWTADSPAGQRAVSHAVPVAGAGGSWRSRHDALCRHAFSRGFEGNAHWPKSCLRCRFQRQLQVDDAHHGHESYELTSRSKRADLEHAFVAAASSLLFLGCLPGTSSRCRLLAGELSTAAAVHPAHLLLVVGPKVALPDPAAVRHLHASKSANGGISSAAGQAPAIALF